MAKKNQKKNSKGRNNSKKKGKGNKNRANTKIDAENEEQVIATEVVEEVDVETPVKVESGEETTTEPESEKNEVPEPEAVEEVVAESDPVKGNDVPTEAVEDPVKEVEEIISKVVDEAIEEKKEDPVSTIPPGLQESLSLLTEEQQALAISLCSKEANQTHLFEKWPAPSKVSSPSSEATNKVKIGMMEKLLNMDKAYPTGGLLGYISNAKDLLEKSKNGVNPLDGWSPHVPQGETFELGTSEFDQVEKLGLNEIGKCGFVLVAGGLGERLGYGDIKVRITIKILLCFMNVYLISKTLCISLIYQIRLDSQLSWPQKQLTSNFTSRLF